MSGDKKDIGKTVLIFAYGTLKAGHTLNSSWMLTSTSIKQHVLSGYTLFDLGPYPALIKIDLDCDDPPKVAGEIWRMPLEAFEELQAMEERVGYTTQTVTQHRGEPVKAFVYHSITASTTSWEKTGRVEAVVEIED